MSGMNTGSSSRQRLSCSDVVIFSISGSSGHSGSRRFDQRRAELLAEHRLDLARRPLDDRFVGLDARERQHRLADDADAHALERPRRARRRRCVRVRIVEDGASVGRS